MQHAALRCLARLSAALRSRTPTRNYASFTPPAGQSISGPYLRYSYALHSYFCLPEQGMTEFEVLSRSSLIIVPTSAAFRGHRKYHFLGPYHVTHPWLYTQFYSDQEYAWLQFVREEAVQNKLGIREEKTGRIVKEFRFAAKTYPHAVEDLIALHLENEQEFVDYCNSNGISINTVSIEPVGISPGDPVVVVGHSLVQEESSGQAEPTEVLIPTCVEGVVNFTTPRHGYAATKTPAIEGMCGGPVMAVNPRSKEISLTCIGVVEGLVKENVSPAYLESLQPYVRAAQHSVELNTVFIRANEIFSFVRSVERKMAERAQSSRQLW